MLKYKKRRSMSKEEWKSIEGFEGLYDVSSLGRVRSYPRNGTKDKDIHILHQGVTKSGYCRVALSKNDRMKNYAVHRLVAQAFIPNPENKSEVNHIDGNPNNNTINNLEWNTRSENHLHRVYALRHNTLNKCKKVLCVETGKIFPSVQAAARTLGKDHKGIVRAVKGQYERSYGYHWRYVK